jgi:signal transduction histidine kinase
MPDFGFVIRFSSWWLISLIPLFASGSNPADSLKAALDAAQSDSDKVEILLALSGVLSVSNSGEAAHHAREAIALANHAGWVQDEARAYSRLAVAQKHLAHYDSSASSFRKSLMLFRSIRDTSGEAGINMHLGILFQRIGELDSSGYYLFISLRQAEAINDSNLEAKALNNLASLFQENGDCHKSIEYSGRALEIQKQLNNRLSVARASENMAICYTSLNQLLQAEKYYGDALQIYRDLNETQDMARIEINLSNLHEQSGNYTEAMSHAKRAYSLYSQLGTPNGILFALKSMAVISYKQNELRQAEDYALQALGIAVSSGSRDSELGIYESLHRIYSAVGNYELAYDYLQRAASLNDSLFNVQKEGLISEMQAKYETEKKEQENQLLTQTNLNQQLVINRQRILRDSLIAVTILIIIIGWLLFRNLRSRQLRKQQEERIRISSDLHDEVGSTLSSIGLISAYADQKLEEMKLDDARLALQEISTSARQMTEDMSDIVWYINPRNHHWSELLNRLKSYAFQLTHSLNVSLDFHAGSEVEKLRANPVLLRNCYLICKEAVNNSAKYSACSQLFVQMNLVDHHLTILIKDDGKGFDNSIEGSGNGLRNMVRRAEECGGHLKLSSAPGKGTQVDLKIPLS